MNKLKSSGMWKPPSSISAFPTRKATSLVGEMRAIYRSMAIVIATGYGEDALRKRFKNDDRITFLGEPYLAEELRRALAALNVAE